MTHQNDQTKPINYCHSLMNYSLCISLSYSFFISIISPSKPEGYTAMCEQSPSFVFSLYIHEIQMNVFQKVYFCFFLLLPPPSSALPSPACGRDLQLNRPDIDQPLWEEVLHSAQELCQVFFCAHHILYLHV